MADTPLVDGAGDDIDGGLDAAMQDGHGSQHGDGGSDVWLDGLHDGSRYEDTGRDTMSDRSLDTGLRALRTLHNCDPTGDAVQDLTGLPMVTIVSGPGYMFTPSCARVRVGQMVRFVPAPEVDWTTHPLTAGEIVMGMEVPDPGSPIPYRDEGNAPVDVIFSEPGSYGYYCTRHWLAGHVGALHVVR